MILRRVATIVILLVCNNFVANAQNGYLDDLRKELSVLSDRAVDSNLYKTYYDFVRYYLKRDRDSTIFYLERSLDIAQQAEYDTGIQKSAFNLAQQLKLQGLYVSAFEYAQLCLASNPKPFMQSRCLKLLGDLQRDNAMFAQAYESYMQADTIGQKLKDTQFLGNLYNSLALYHDLDYNYEQAIVYHRKSADISKSFGDYEGYATSLRNIAVIYNDIKEYDNALTYCELAKANLFEDSPDVAMYLAQTEAIAYAGKGDINRAMGSFEASNFIAKQTRSKQLYSSNTFNMASIFLESGDFRKAEDHINKGLSNTELGQTRFRFLVLYANLRRAQNTCGESKKLLDQATPLLPEVTDFYVKREYYKSLAELTACFGDHKGTGSFIDSTEVYADSSYFNKKEAEFKRLEAKYQSKLKQDSINILKLKNRLASEKIKRNQYQSVGLLFLLLLAGILAWLYRRYYNTQLALNQALESEKEELIFKNEELIEINKAMSNKPLVAPIETKVPEKIELRIGDKIQFYDPVEIQYIEAEDNGSRIYVEGKSIWVDIPMKDIQNKLDEESFLQIFRSTIINTKFIHIIEKGGIKMKDGAILKIGRTYKQSVKDRFM